ncbi:hypothetical protein, partial [Nocardiopsis sp. NRRL B-16309]|uniref:hypothetical protein n=1 Tax=Nocardiopsis sp. NRRL B-16309 TaxID=1519494 RepID=UPI000AACCBAD
GDGGLAAGRGRAGELLSGCARLGSVRALLPLGGVGLLCAQRSLRTVLPRCCGRVLWSGGDGGLAAGRGRAGELLSGCARLGSVRAL